MAKQFEETLLADLVNTAFICLFLDLMQVPREALSKFSLTCFFFVWLLW